MADIEALKKVYCPEHENWDFNLDTGLEVWSISLALSFGVRNCPFPNCNSAPLLFIYCSQALCNLD